jgi:hypothetical protein
MQELTVSHEISLKSNMTQVKESIAQTIAKYDVVVTEDRLTEAKELMAQFNKDKKAFTDKCKSFLSVINAPIDEFRAEQKEIEAMFDEGRAKIKVQVDTFEAKKLTEISAIIEDYRDKACIEKGINASSIIIDDLVKLSAVNSNKSGYSLSKATVDTIDQRIQFVENEVLKARLEAEEKAKREREIAEQARIEAEEKARQREAELIAKAEREKAEAVERARREAMSQQQTMAFTQMPEPTQAPLPQTQQVIDGKKVFVVTATFHVTASVSTDPDKISAKFKSLFDGCGITTLNNISVD